MTHFNQPDDTTRPGDAAATPDLGDSPGLGKVQAAAATVVISFVVGFLAWASLAPLDGAAIANGVVAIDGKRKTVEHLEGGIVRAIMVRDGDRVEAGQILVELDRTKAEAGLELVLGRYLSALALEDRLRTERDGGAGIEFTAVLVGRSGERRVREIVQAQRNIFATRRHALGEQIAILNQRSAQFTAEIRGIESQVTAANRQLALLRDEIKDVAELRAKGLARKSRLLGLRRRAAEIEGRRDMSRAQIARARQVMTETRLRMNGARTARLNEVVDRLRAVQAERYDLEERLAAGRDVLRRTRIRAPITGTVLGLGVHTTGGVLSPGEAVMDIVPSASRLVVEARIDPNDIDVVRQGLAAKIRFTAFNQRTTAPAEGVIVSVSADRMTDQATGEKYYLARVEIGDRAGAGALRPGMPAEVMIVTERRTLMGYLIEPITKSLNRAFRES